MPTKDNCSSCGKVVARTTKSLPSILCHECRSGRQPKSRTSDYISPSRVDNCVDCGVQVERSWTSAEQIICRVCRRKRKPLAQPTVHDERGCRTCGLMFTPRTKTQVYCVPSCRPTWTDNRLKAPASQRGYGPEHQRERKKWKARVEEGDVNCARCAEPIHPDEPWDLDHTDDRTGYLGPSHRSCNRADGGRKRHQPGAAPIATAHLKWEWRDCQDCGRKCYGKRCKHCHQARRTSTPRDWAEPSPMFNLCAGCGDLCGTRARWCSTDCCARTRYRRAVGIPDHAPLYSRA